MDSMLGYKNETYLYFGRIPAKMDDLFNYIPARLTAWFMVLASFLTGLNGKNAWKIYRRDCRKHASPNSAQSEAVCAGALDVQLAGDAVYFGKIHKKGIYRRSTPQDRGGRHSKGRKADVCDDGSDAACIWRNQITDLFAVVG